MYDFTHHRPASVDAAAKAISGASDGKIMAGGMTLIPTLKQRLASPSDVVDLGGIKDLKGIREEGGKIVIGAMTTQAELLASDLVAGMELLGFTESATQSQAWWVTQLRCPMLVSSVFYSQRSKRPV